MKKITCLLTIILFALNAYPANIFSTSINSSPDNIITAESIFGNSIHIQSAINHYGDLPQNTHTAFSSRDSIQLQSSVILQDTTCLQNTIATSAITTYTLPDNAMARKPDFLHSTVSRFIIPAGLITYGIVAQNNPLLQRWDNGIKSEAYRLFPGRMYADDWIQYAPVVGFFTLKLAGVKSEHKLLDMTIVAATSYIFTTAIVRTVKSTVHKMRPDGSADNSFPSGHTATAFAGAHLLYKEYRDVSPWIGIAGYTVATATGMMRIMNRRHWFSDVVAGAGVGILSVELAYLLMPIFERWTGGGKQPDNLSVSPVVGENYTGVGLAYCF